MYLYRVARADKACVRVAFDSSDRNEGVLLSYEPSQQGLIQLDSRSLPVHGNPKTGPCDVTIRLRIDHIALATRSLTTLQRSRQSCHAAFKLTAIGCHSKESLDGVRKTVPCDSKRA
jgi:hypothetical protein